MSGVIPSFGHDNPTGLCLLAALLGFPTANRTGF